MSDRWRARTVLPVLGALASFWALASCGTPEPDYVVSELPEYTPKESAVFDDSFSAEVFDPEASTPKKERFRATVQEADLIVPVRLTAINAKRSDGSVRYQLIADPNGAPLKGVAEAGVLEFEVSPNSPSQPMLKALDTQLVGAKLIFLTRRYQRDGKMVMHFRAEADTVPTRQAISAALSGADELEKARPPEPPLEGESSEAGEPGPSNNPAAAASSKATAPAPSQAAPSQAVPAPAASAH